MLRQLADRRGRHQALAWYSWARLLSFQPLAIIVSATQTYPFTLIPPCLNTALNSSTGNSMSTAALQCPMKRRKSQGDASAFTVASITMTHHEYRIQQYLPIHWKTPSYLEHCACIVCGAHNNSSAMGEPSVYLFKTSRWRSVRLSSFVSYLRIQYNTGDLYIANSLLRGRVLRQECQPRLFRRRIGVEYHLIVWPDLRSVLLNYFFDLLLTGLMLWALICFSCRNDRRPHPSIV